MKRSVQDFEKLAKVVELELFSRAQKATYTVDFARGCAPFKDYLERLGRAPYLALLSSDESARLLETLKRDAQEARQRTSVVALSSTLGIGDAGVGSSRHGQD